MAALSLQNAAVCLFRVYLKVVRFEAMPLPSSLKQ